MVSSSKSDTAPLLAGVASIDVTPEMGIQIDGDIGRPRPVEEIRDPLYAKALVLQVGGKKLCILSMDLVAITNNYADEIRDRAAKQFGLDRDAIMVHVTQNHSAPGIGHFVCRDECTLIPEPHRWLRMGDDRYIPGAVDKAVRVIGQANAALKPAKIGAASGLDPRVAFNRRYVMRNGKTMTNPGYGNPEIVHVEGPADPEVGVVSVARQDGSIASLLLHHTCHPTHGYPHRYISADWPGTWCDAMKKVLGSGCVPLVLNGCCGNTISNNWVNPYHVEDQQRMGEMLAETAGQALQNVQYQDNVELDYLTTKLRIPLRPLVPEEMEKARQLLREHPQPMWRKDEPDCCEWDWIYAVGRVDLADRAAKQPYYDYEIQAFKLGQTAIVAMPGEPFVEAQLKMKLNSPVRHTYIAHMSNGYVGYIPTKNAFNGGGYETWNAGWSQLVHEALDMIADRTVQLLNELYAKKTAALAGTVGEVWPQSHAKIAAGSK